MANCGRIWRFFSLKELMTKLYSSLINARFFEDCILPHCVYLAFIVSTASAPIPGSWQLCNFFRSQVVASTVLSF